MARFTILSFLLAPLLLVTPNCGAEDTVNVTDSVKVIMERINRRYDDFFRYQHYLEEHQESLKDGRDERKKSEARRAEELEKARREYIKARRERASTVALEAQWEADQKERAQHIEMLRRRFVQQRDELEEYTKKGRKIPEMKEFDLEGY